VVPFRHGRSAGSRGKEIRGVLTAIGLDEAEEGAYRLLVALGAADLDDMARRMAVDKREIGRLLEALEERGLVAQSSSQPGRRWIAAPPAVALRALLIQHRHELDQAELLAAELAEEYRTKADESDSHELVEVVVGGAAVTHRFLQLQLGAEVEVCSLVTDKPVAVSGPENEAEAAAVARGVAYRVVIERGVLSSAADFAEVSAALGRDVDVRVVDRVPTKLVVADGVVAMVPLSVPGSEPAALVIHASGLLESLTALFDAVWREATPLVLSEGNDGAIHEEQPVPDIVDLQILSLLLAGFTDARIAKQLDLGTRTVQRRIQGLMHRAEVKTRLQLGWHAYDRGWLTRQ
jgi:sugar-specific transcriptional regulator TrmB